VVRRLDGLLLVTLVLLTVQPSNRLTAQVAPNRATSYLHPTAVQDARAVWINPAGLAVLREASIYAEAAIGDPGARGRLRQINAGFNARGLSFAYQRDMFDAGVRGHTYRLGLAGASGGLAAGFAIAHYRGANAKSTGWDIGVTYSGNAGLTFGGAVVNVSQPLVRGLRQRLTFTPGATWHPVPVRALGISTHARVTPDSVAAYAFGLSWSTAGQGRWPLEIIARLDTDGGLRRGAFALGLSLGNQDRVGLIASTPGDVSRVDVLSLYGLATRLPVTGRRR
jgi:hypothetical protein